MNGGPRTESKARLGVFVVSAVVLAVAGLLALGAARILVRTVPVHLYFEESVQGLERGSPISYRGVELGRVAQITMRQPRDRGATAMGHQAVIEVVCDLLPEQLAAFGGASPSREEVKAAIRREVAQGLRVRVAWRNIGGQKYLELDYVDSNDEDMRPPDLGFAPEEPYIPTVRARSFTDIQRDLATTLSNLAKVDYAAIAAKVQVLLEQLSQKVSEFRAEEVSSSFRDAADALRQIASDEQMQRALGRLDSITAEIERLGKRTNELLADPAIEQGIHDIAAAARSLRDTADTVSARLPETMSRIDGAIDDTRKALADAKIPETTEAMRRGIGDVSGAARNVGALREDLRSALRTMADASRSIARLADFLERHPESLLRGRGEDGGRR